MHRARLTILILGLLFLIPAQSFAYVYNGHRWPGNTVPFYVNVSSCTGASAIAPALVASAVLFDVETAAFQWHDQSNANLSFVFAGTTTSTGMVPDGTVTVWCSLEPNGSGNIARTFWWFGGDGNIFDFDIEIEAGNYPYVTSDEACNGASVFVLDILAHEFGHGLSLGHSEFVDATMWAPTSPCSTKERTLYSDDIAAIEAVYGLRSTPTEPPPALTSCTTAGTVYPIGSFLASGTLRNGAANAWLTDRQAEGWVLYTTSKAKGFTAFSVVCGLGDEVQGLGL